MAKVRMSALLALMLLGIPHGAHAWGDLGHEVVGDIAFRELKPAAFAKVLDLIREDPDFWTFSRSCTFPDHPRKRALEHFVNVSRDTQHIAAPTCEQAPECLFTAIANDRAILASPTASDASKLEALKFVGHWVGDIHQPMHVSFADDRGGNKIRATGPCAQDDLHAVWDSCILQHEFEGDGLTIGKELSAEITDADRQAWLSGSVAAWADESFQITRDPASEYCILKNGGCWYRSTRKVFNGTEKSVAVNATYLDANTAVVNLRLKQAGVRLGKLLNDAFAP